MLDHNQHRGIAAAADKQWSSGPLSPGHHFLEKNCEACHQRAFVSVTDTACLSCHRADLNKAGDAQIASRIRRLGGPFPPDPAPDHAPRDRLMAAAPPDPNLARRINSWVAATFSHPNNRCASCHTEHVGNGTSAQGHSPVTPDQIKRNDCKDCHTGLQQRLAGAKVMDAPDWDRHPDFRLITTTGFKGDQPRLLRIALSAMPMEKDGLIFGHDVHLSATGGVARQAMELGKARGYGAPLACANCHRAAPDGGFVKIDMPRDCGTCHSLTFARKNGVDQLLPHGHPVQVIAALKIFFTGQPQYSSGPELFIGRPGLRGGTHPVQGIDHVAVSVRAAFEPGAAPVIPAMRS